MGEDVSVRDAYAYRTSEDGETVDTAAAKFHCKPRAALRETRRMLSHSDVIYEDLKGKTLLPGGTWVVLPGISGAAIEAHVTDYLGWDLTGKVQQWRLQAREDTRLTLTVDAKTVFHSLGWSTSKGVTSRIGASVINHSGDRGEVVAYRPPSLSSAGHALWKVRHADGDFEDMDEREIHAAICGTSDNGSDSDSGSSSASLDPGNGLMVSSYEASGLFSGALPPSMDSQPSLSVAEIIANSTAEIQKRWREQKAAEAAAGPMPPEEEVHHLHATSNSYHPPIMCTDNESSDGGSCEMIEEECAQEALASPVRRV